MGVDIEETAMPLWRRISADPASITVVAVLIVLLALWFSPNSISPDDALGIKIFILGGTILLTVCWKRIPPPARVALLVALTVTASLNYYRWGPRALYERVDVYDVVHYYLGAKYFDELGYEGLYPALILADRDNGPKSSKLNRYRQQTDSGYEFRNIEEALARGREIRQTNFSTERWRRFERDSLVLLRDLGLSAASWRKLVADRGFNGSPAWIALAKPFVAVVPASAVKFLCLMDLVLIVSALFVVGYAYGAPVALWAAIFLAASYSMRWPVAGEALFRYVWLASLLWALALVKLDRPVAAGAALTLSSLLRLFPAAWLFGPAAQALHQFDGRPFRLGNVERFYWLMAAGVVCFAFAAFLWVSLDIGGRALIEHARDMRIHVHVDQLVSRHIGFAKALVFEGGLEPKYMTEADRSAIAKLKPITGFLALLLLIGLALGVRTLSRDQAFALGFIPFFLLTMAHDYHGVSRVMLVVYHASRLDRGRDRLCLAWLLGLEMFTCWATLQYPEHIAFRVGYLAWGTSIYVLFVIGTLLSDWRKQRVAGAEVGTSSATN